MSNTPTPQPTTRRFPPALIGAGVLVIALGFGLPMLTSGSVPEPQDTPRDLIAKKNAANDPVAPIQPPDATGLGASLLRLLIGLAVVCGLCVLVARWFRPKPTAAPGAMEVVASIEVARCVIHLVRAGDRRLLIGTDLGGVKAILELPGPEPEVLLAPLAETSATSTPADAMPLVTVSTPAAPASSEEILKFLLQLRTKSNVTPPS
jgi:flagellar protein FliO/FliZ